MMQESQVSDFNGAIKTDLEEIIESSKINPTADTSNATYEDIEDTSKCSRNIETQPSCLKEETKEKIQETAYNIASEVESEQNVEYSKITKEGEMREDTYEAMEENITESANKKDEPMRPKSARGKKKENIHIRTGPINNAAKWSYYTFIVMALIIAGLLASSIFLQFQIQYIYKLIAVHEQNLACRIAKDFRQGWETCIKENISISKNFEAEGCKIDINVCSASTL